MGELCSANAGRVCEGLDTRRPQELPCAWTKCVKGYATFTNGDHMARLAQSAERKALALVVVGSSPTVGVCFVHMHSSFVSLQMILLPHHICLTFRSTKTMQSQRLRSALLAHREP